MCVITSQYEIYYAAKITFAKPKRFPPEHNLPTTEKIHWNKQHFGMR